VGFYFESMCPGSSEPQNAGWQAKATDAPAGGNGTLTSPASPSVLVDNPNSEPENAGWQAKASDAAGKVQVFFSSLLLSVRSLKAPWA
jgi:hypothetical protein